MPKMNGYEFTNHAGCIVDGQSRSILAIKHSAFPSVQRFRRKSIRDFFKDMNTIELIAGDVFLMEGTSKLSPALVAAQKARFYKNARSSHVMFSFGDGVFVHSTLGAGVEFSPYMAALKGCKDDWRVIRNTLITADQKELMQKASIYFVDQAYNKKFLFKSNDHSSFCSELVAKIYKKAGVPLFGKKRGRSRRRILTVLQTWAIHGWM